MKEYKTLMIRSTGKETQDLLNDYAELGWKVICSYASHGEWLILEREKKK